MLVGGSSRVLVSFGLRVDFRQEFQHGGALL